MAVSGRDGLMSRIGRYPPGEVRFPQSPQIKFFEKIGLQSEKLIRQQFKRWITES